MNAHTRRKWNSLKIFMYILISACALLVFWCRGACAVHLTPLEYSSLNFERSRHHYYPKVLKKAISPSSQHDFISQLRNHSPVTESKLILSHYQQQQKSSNIRQSSEHFELQESWKLRMRQKRRIQAHRREKHLLEQLVNKRSENQLIAMHNNFIPNSHSNLNIYYLKSFINEKILTQYNQRNIKKLNHKKNITLKNLQSRNEDLYKTLNEIMLNISVASNRNRRDSRYHHEQQPQMQQLQLSSQSVNINNAGNRSRRGRKRYCSARDAKTLAFEAPTVFEGKIKSMTTDRQANFSVTIEILRAYKQQASLTLPRQVRLQFAYKNVSECDIYREEFRHRGFVRDELEQGKIYFLFVKQISLGNFTILGQPIRKNSRTAKDIEIGVSEKYGKKASIESISQNLAVKEGKRVRIVCKVDGEPAPKVTWFKDGRSINRNRTKYIFVHLRRRSDLIIKSAIWNDSGKYECRAKNKLTTKRPVSNFTWLDVFSKQNLSTDRSTSLMNTMQECPAGGQNFCLNGGKCWFIESLQEPSCVCPEGFSGKNCEDKTPNITASTYNKQQECPQYLGSFYC